MIHIDSSSCMCSEVMPTALRNFMGASAFFIRAYFETTETTCKNNFFFSPRNYAAFLNRRAVARRKGKLFQTSCFPSLEDVVVNYTDAPLDLPNRIKQVTTLFCCGIIIVK